MENEPVGGGGPARSGVCRGIRSFVLRPGRMTAAQERCYKALSGRFCIPFSPEPLSCKAVFGRERPVTVEIGFGSGGATARIAGANPEKDYLGIEVHRPGIGRLLWEIESRGLENIRIIEHDAVEVLEKMIAPASVSAFHVFFPDPWPKKRHHKRRLMTRPFTGLLAEKLIPGAYIYMVTDWEDYADWALRELEAVPGIANPYGGFAPPRDWRPKTRFEEKGLARKHEVRELYFVKSGGG